MWSALCVDSDEEPPALDGTANATGAFGAVADAEEPAKVEDPLVSDGESGAEEAPCCLAVPGQT